MTGTPSRTATAASRGVVGRKLEAKPRPEEHEPHRRHSCGGRGGVGIRSPMSSGPRDVDAAGTWGEGHAPYPGRSVHLPSTASANDRHRASRKSVQVLGGRHAPSTGANETCHAKDAGSEARAAARSPEGWAEVSRRHSSHRAGWRRAERVEWNRHGAFECVVEAQQAGRRSPSRLGRQVAEPLRARARRVKYARHATRTSGTRRRHDDGGGTAP